MIRQNSNNTKRLPPKLQSSGLIVNPKYIFGCDPGENCGICQTCLELKILGTTYPNEKLVRTSLPNRVLTNEIWRRLMRVRYDDHSSNGCGKVLVPRATTTNNSNRVDNRRVVHKVIKEPVHKKAQKKKADVAPSATKSGTPSTNNTTSSVATSTAEALRCSGRVGGITWGCGQTFAVMDGLKAHWASPAGTPCLEQFVRLRRGNNNTN
ncbi:hypothetical protein CANINC_000736 [Pichia inconspicua]|uniref:Uncharacterized protein n=1 Tax=Pichia inconspicua TaxID=52247 RepID=A0A4T0X5F5_9ASCO|nr:hypothetical protein CANINC_000736 [[Candida] inconspicua]